MFKRISDFLRFDRVVLVGLHLENPAPGVAEPNANAKMVYADGEGTTYGSCDWIHGPPAGNDGYSKKTKRLIAELIASIEEDFGRHIFDQVAPADETEGLGEQPRGPETTTGLTAGLGGSK